MLYQPTGPSKYFFEETVFPSLSSHCAEYDLVDVIEEKCKLRQALIKDKRFDELFYMVNAIANHNDVYSYFIKIENIDKEDYSFRQCRNPYAQS